MSDVSVALTIEFPLFAESALLRMMVATTLTARLLLRLDPVAFRHVARMTLVTVVVRVSRMQADTTMW